MSIYINIGLGVLTVIVTFISYYFAVKSIIKNKAAGAINYAENIQALGVEKMHIAVEQVYAIVPAILKPIFNKAFIEQIIQEVFEEMKKFAEKRVNKEQ